MGLEILIEKKNLLFCYKRPLFELLDAKNIFDCVQTLNVDINFRIYSDLCPLISLNTQS